jgi:3'-5' exonuclease
MNRIQYSYFDIETGPASDELLAKIKPEFKAPANYKDEEKIKASIAEQETAWKERAALDAATGQVICIGLASGLASFRALEGTEKDILAGFWLWLEVKVNAGNKIVGFNSHGFDLPFVARRSWVHGLDVPRLVRNGRYWCEASIDVMEVWMCGNREQRISLDALAKVLGVGEKSGNGKDFAALYKQDRTAAIQYLKHDIELLRRCADKLIGVNPSEEVTSEMPS